MATGITGNPWIDVPLVGLSMLSGGGGGGSKVPWEQEYANRQGVANQFMSNPAQMGLYYNLLNMSGAFPRSEIQNMASTLPVSEQHRVLGWQPQTRWGETYGTGNKTLSGNWSGAPVSAPKARSSRTGNTFWGNQPVAATPTPAAVPTPSPTAAPTPDTAPGTNQLDQSFLNTGYGRAAELINNSARDLANRLMQQGYSPEQANQIAAERAAKQKQEFKLSMMQQLPQFQFNNQASLLGMTPQSTMPVQYPPTTQTPDYSQDMWGGLGALAQVLGYQKGGRQTAVGTPIQAPGSTSPGTFGGGVLPWGYGG